MMTDLIRIRYDKESYLASHYLTEFFKMCGFFVYEECTILEDTEFETDEEVIIEEIIIEAPKKEIGKQLLVETISNLSDWININDFRYLIDAYADFSIYASCFWLENYKKFDYKQNISKHIEVFYNATNYLTNCKQKDPNNFFLNFAILYCKYNINKCCKETYLYEFNIDDLATEIVNFHNKASYYFCNSSLFLLCLLYELEPIYAPMAVKYIDNLLDYPKPYNALFFYQAYKVYSKYAANTYDAINSCRTSLKSNPNDVFVLYSLVTSLHNYSEADVKDSSKLSDLVNEQIEHLNHILELLNQKEKVFPLSPQELKLKLVVLVSLMQCHFHKPIEDHLGVLHYGQRFLERYYDAAINATIPFNLFNSAEEQFEVTNYSLRKTMAVGYSTMYYSAHYLRLDSYASKYMEKASLFNN